MARTVVAEVGSPPDGVGDIRKVFGRAGMSLPMLLSLLWEALVTAGGGASSLLPETPADMLAALLGGCVEGTLQLSHSEMDGEPLVDGVMEPLVEEESR